MLDVNPETVCFLISKAREFHAKEEVVLPDVPGSPAEDWGRQVLADHIDDPVYQEFQETFSDLEPDQQHEVVALLWLGRGDFDLASWTVAVAEARANWTPTTADYLMAHPMLADHLLEGMILHGYNCDA
jgi:hypothetical protein